MKHHLDHRHAHIASVAAERAAAANMPSAEAPPEPQARSARCAPATCSLPASSAEALIESWKADAVRTTSDPYRAALMRCAVELRREMARATERQPEENAEMTDANRTEK